MGVVNGSMRTADIVSWQYYKEDNVPLIIGFDSSGHMSKLSLQNVEITTGSQWHSTDIGI